MPKTNFFKVALACVVTFFSLIGCEKMGDEMSNTKTFVKGDYLLTPKVEIVVETIKEVVHDTLYYKVVVMDSIFIHDTLPPRYIYDTVEVEVPVLYPVHDTVIVVQRDTVWETIIEERTDTLYLRDTIDKSFSGMLRGKCYVAGRKKAAIQQYILDKGEIVNQEVLYGTFHFSITAGKTEVKNEAVLNSTTPNMTDNSFSFDVTDGVGGANVNNVWGYEYNAVAQFDGFTETIDAELSIETADFYKKSNLEWHHMVTASLNGIPQATATWEFWKEEEVVVPIPDPVWGVEFADEAWPISATTQQTYAYPTKDGVRTGEEVKVYAPIHGNITAGKTIYKTSNGTVELVSTSAEVSGENAKFTYNLENKKFNDNWKISVSKEGSFTYEGHGITKTATIPLKAETSVESVSFSNNNGTYSNKATLFLDSFAIGSDIQMIIVEKPEVIRGVEKEGPFFSTDMRTATMKFFPTVNGERTGAVLEKGVNLEYTFTPGAALEFNSNETPSIKDANAVLVGNEAFIPHTLGSTEFNANFTYGGTTRVTFSYSDEYVSDEVTVDLNISYDVKATGSIEQNGTSYSTPAALYANGVEVKNEKFVFKVYGIDPTYPGYRVYNAGQWAITRIYNQNATTSLVVLVGTLEHIQTGEIYAIHQVLEGSAGNLPENFQKISTPSFGEPYSMYYNVAASAWNYGSIVGAKKGTTNANWMYFNWSRTDNQIVSVNTATDLLDDIVLYQLGSEDNLSSEAGNISLAYNGTTITVVSDK